MIHTLWYKIYIWWITANYKGMESRPLNSEKLMGISGYWQEGGWLNSGMGWLQYTGWLSRYALSCQGEQLGRTFGSIYCIMRAKITNMLQKQTQ
jgi:hypothetical protein